MEKKSISEVLLSLASGEKGRSEIARLRDVFGSVETALSAGVSRVAVLKALHGQGFTMTLKTFDNAIYRIRKTKNKKPREGNAGQFTARFEDAKSTKEKPEQVAGDESPVGSHNPVDLTQIMSAPVDLQALSKHSKRKKQA